MRSIARLESPALLENLPKFIAVVSGAARAEGLDPQKIGCVELAVEEAVTNICKYAGPEGPAAIGLSCLADDGILAVEIADDGRPFDMTARADPDLTVPLEDRPIGGLGVFLIKKVTDRVSYERRPGRNVLRLEFRRTPGA
ncbi:MAG: ATP-binding protein [Elusimicrobia bacterium]|nr:ATP-binding protein [Elusimicrobiota bacterium]